MHIDEGVTAFPRDHHTAVRIGTDMNIISQMNMCDSSILVEGSAAFHRETDVRVIEIHPVSLLLIQMRYVAMRWQRIAPFSVDDFNGFHHSSSFDFSGP